MILPPFRLHRPETVEQALLIAGDCGNDCDYVAGGTDLLPNYKNRLNHRRDVISLGRVASLSRSLHETEDGRLAVGAMCRLVDLERDPKVVEDLPGLHEALTQIATPLIRVSGTIGGNQLVETRCYYFNQSFDWRASKGFCMKADGDVCLVVPQKEICYAIYAGDTAPVLQTLGASYVLIGYDGEREVAAEDFYRPDGIRKNVLTRGEILAAILFPARAAKAKSGYVKLRLRDSFDFPDMGVAASLWEEDGRVVDLRVSVTAVSMTPTLFPEVTDSLKGQPVGRDLVEHVAEEVRKRSMPVRNVLFPPAYRKRMVGVFTRRLLERLAGLGPRGG
jgi:4-hydroxybenzoyl-CoA reductase subunit beta